MNRILRVVAILAATIGFSSGLHAESAYDTVERVSAEVLGKVEEWRSVYEEDPDKFFDEVASVLDPAVDYRRMAFVVMGREYYLAASDEQRERFVVVFRKSMLETYAKGLLSVSNERVETLRPDRIDESVTNTDVEQILHSSKGKYSIIYRMRLGSDGVWQLNNVTLEGVSLGSTFRNQFQQSAEKHGGDIDKVIDAWQLGASDG